MNRSLVFLLHIYEQLNFYIHKFYNDIDYAVQSNLPFSFIL